MDCLSGVRVRSGHVLALTNFSPPKSARRGLIRACREVCYSVLVGVRTREIQHTWITSNNSIHSIQQDKSVSRRLRSSVSQAQPSARDLVRCQCFAGTQENHGNKPPLANGNTSRAVQSYLLLACGGDRQVKLQIHPKRSGEYVPKSNVLPKARAWLRRHKLHRSCETGKSGFVCLGSSVHHRHIGVT